MEFAIGIYQDKRLDVTDERREVESSAVDVGRQRAAEANAVYARLLFANRPGFWIIRLFAVEVIDQLRPLDSGLNLYEALTLSKLTSRLSCLVSSRIVSRPNCWPPIACLPPPTLTARPSHRASRSAAWISSMDFGVRIRLTRVALSCDCTSLTSTPSGSATRPIGAQDGRNSAPPTLAALSRNSRRVSMASSSLYHGRFPLLTGVG